jgi:hypothetical protein
MTEKFSKKLESYVNNNNVPIKGKYHFKLPDGLEPECYPMEIDYESNDEDKPEAYQYNGYIVVGFRSYLQTSPIIIPFNTSANREEDITLTEKRNTVFSAVVNAFSDSDFDTPIEELPYRIKFMKDSFKDYHENANNYDSLINSDYNTAFISNTVYDGYSTNNNGVGTTNVKIGDIYSADEEISDVNTIIFKCHGTKNRGEDNYVPSIIEAPLILGTTDVYIKLANTETVLVTIDDEPKIAPATCGGGDVQLGCDWIYKAFMRDDNKNSQMKYGYKNYLTDRSKLVKVGSVQLQILAGDHWETVPASDLSPANENTTVNPDGSIIQTPTKENGGISVYWQNHLDRDTRQNILYRWIYTGKVGATRSQRTVSFYLAIAPEYDNPSVQTTQVIFTNPADNVLNCTFNETCHITGKVVIEGTNNVVPNSGTVEVAIGNNTYSAQVGSNGTFDISLPNNTVGNFNTVVEFTPNTEYFVGATKSVTVNVSKKGSTINVTSPASAPSITGKYKDTVTIDGNVIATGTSTKLNGTLQLVLGGTTYTANTTNGNFSINIPSAPFVTTDANLTFTPTDTNYSNASLPLHFAFGSLNTTINPTLTDNVWVTKRIGTLAGTVKDEKGRNVDGTLSCSDFSLPVVNGVFNKEIDLTASRFNNVTTTSFNLTFTPTGSGINSSNKTINASISPLEVNVLSYNSWLRVMNSEDRMTELFKLRINNGTSTPVTSGNLKLEIKPVNDDYDIDYTEIWSTSISSLNQWSITLASFGSNFDDLIDEIKSKGLLCYVNYTIRAIYTSTSPIYNSKTVVFEKSFGYCCSPELELTTTSAYLSNNRTYPSPSMISITDTSVEDEINGIENNDSALISREFTLADNNSMTLAIRDSHTGDYIGGIEWGMWFISDETVHIWAVNDDGSLRYDNQGNKIEWTNYYYDGTDVPISPAYAGYPIHLPNTITPMIRQTTYNQDLGAEWEAKLTSYDDPMVFEWKAPYTELTSINLYMYITLSGALGNLFRNNYEVNSPYHSLVGGVNPDHTFTHPIDARYHKVFKIKLNIVK